MNRGLRSNRQSSQGPVTKKLDLGQFGSWEVADFDRAPWELIYTGRRQAVKKKSQCVERKEALVS